MKPGSNRRPRTRPHNNNNTNNNNKRQGGRSSYDSNGPDGKVRGTAQQVLEKYQTLGRDATSAGDRVAAEAYFQFAEHYYRVVSAEGGMQLPRRDQHGDDVLENDTVGDEKIAPSTSAKALPSDPAREPIDELPGIEIINVPIMPGPIALPISDEASVVNNDTEPVGLETQISATSEDDADSKPKPVRRRRVKSKLTAIESEVETRPVEV